MPAFWLDYNAKPLDSQMSAPLRLSVIIIVVSGVAALRRCLTALCAQMDAAQSEIIVPYDAVAAAVASLASEFPQVRFHRIDDPDHPQPALPTLYRHQLYDRRRAAGLAVAQGEIIAMTEDHVVPAADWCAQLLAAHASAAAVIGGAIENGIDRPLNWALYYCDFGRYGRPLDAGPAAVISDVNVSYKREVLLSALAVWRDGYAETTLHWHLGAHGHQLLLDPRLVVFEERPRLPLGELIRERLALGHAFGATRRAALPGWKRAAHMCATPLLPLLLLYRCLHDMMRQRRTLRQIATTLPYVLVFVIVYAVGELTGYLMETEKMYPK